jgi:signal transduction histidine kinase
MTAILEEEGFRNTLSASSAIEAYEVLETNDVNLILMDVMMPEIDGLEATEAIRSKQKYNQIPIVMVTATDDDDTLKKSFELGAIDFIRKPVNRVELIARLITILQSQEKDSFILQHSRFDAMEEIIGMLAHQWRQPLSIINAIISTIQIQHELDLLKKDDLKHSLHDILKHTNDLSSMITTFREFFKSDARPAHSNPNDAINEALKLVQDSIEQKKIRLQLDLGDLQPVFYTQNLLIQALANILINAKEAHTRNETKDPVITIRTFKQNNKINILVEDNAGGIPKDIINYIFEPYFSTKEEKNGKGLGLYLAKTILTQQLSGNISVTSQGDKSKFLISFSI